MAIDREVWPRAFAHIDMSAFFASIEQMDFPEYASRPLAVVNGEAGSTIITSSYHARAYGIKTGTKVRDGLAVCPNLVIRPARSQRYAEISTRIMNALESISPDIEQYSVDEAWLELTHVLSIYPSIEYLAGFIKKTVHEASGGLPCSIGISEGKLTAKYCGEIDKGGINIVPPGEIAKIIGEAPIGKICGIGRNIEKYLNGFGIYYCKDMRNKSVTLLSSRFGNIGRRLYSTCLGHDPEPLARPQAPKSMGHGKILPPDTKDIDLVTATFRLLCEKLSARLRANQLMATAFFVGIRLHADWLYEKINLPEPTHDSQVVWRFADRVIQTWQGRAGAFQLQINATRLQDAAVQQLDLFNSNINMTENSKIDAVKDKINNKFGSQTLLPANAVNVSKRNFTVISPAWRVAGVRNTIN